MLTSTMKRCLWFAAALLVSVLYLYALRELLQWHKAAFRTPPTWAFGHLFVVSLLGLVPMLMIVWGSRSIVRIGAVLTGVLIAAQLLSLVVQYYAREQIAQGVSVGLLIDNWPAIRPFLNWKELWLAPLLILVFGLMTGFAQVVIWRPWPRVLATLALVVGTVAVGGFVAHRGYLPKLASGPLLTFLGAPQPAFTSDHIIAMARREGAMLKRYEPASPAPKRNVIVFMADSINPDHLGQFGYHRETMPVLDRLPEYFSSVETAVGRATCGESICGTMSTLASRYFRDTPPYVAAGLGQILQKHGYQSRYFLAGDHRRFNYAHYGKFIEREATELWDYRSSKYSLNSDKVIEEGLSSLPPDDGTPTLIFVFFFSAHLSGEEEPEFEVFGPHLSNQEKGAMRRPRKFSDAERVAMTDHYDNKLLQLDHYVASSLETLSAKGYLDDAIFSFISDHGEELGQEGYFGHSNRRITERLLRIPFILASNESKLPDLSAQTPTQLDLGPTILDMLSVPIPSTWQGDSLFTASTERNFFHEFGMRAVQRNRSCFAVLGKFEKKGRKFTECRTGLGAREYGLFNLENDPYENSNLWQDASADEQNYWRGLIISQFGLE